MIPLHFSQLRGMAECPAKARYFADFGVTETGAMRKGTGVHHLCLTGEQRYVVWPKRRAGNEWEAFKLANTDLFGRGDILSQAEHEQASAIASAVLEHPVAAKLLGGVTEQYIQWKVADRELAGTPDSVGDEWVADLKVTRSVNPRWFQGTAEKSCWTAQLAWYAEGARQCYGAKQRDLYIVGVESNPPHVVQVYKLTSGAVEVADKTWRAWLEQWLVCEATDLWPGYSQTELPLDASVGMALEGWDEL